MANAFIQDRELYPPISPFNSGVVARGMHSIYFEECGNPDGLPVLFLHGGPGAGTGPTHRRLFNPNRFHCVLFDQRGCGKSTPHGSVEDNTTDLLIEDIEALRNQLGIDKFLLFGGSWGSTLALAYAIAHPDRVLGLVLRGIFLGTDPEVEWFLHDMGRFFPEAYDNFVGFLPEEERGDIMGAFFRRLSDDNPRIHMPAAEKWSSYETSCSTLRAGARHVSGRGALSMARIEAHYFLNHCFMPPNHILKNIQYINHLKLHVVQGRHDVICPPVTARKLVQSWGSRAELKMVDDAGHSTFETGIAHALLSALDSFG